MLKHIFWCAIIASGVRLYGQSPEIDQPIFGDGPFFATDQSSWSAFRNMAGLAVSEEISIIAGYQLPFSQSDIQALAIGLNIPYKPSIGITYYRSGTLDFLHQQVGLNTAISSRGYDFGLRIKYWSLSISGFKPMNAVSLDGGIQLKLDKHLQAGIYLSNLTQSKLSQEMLPVAWFAGLKYKASEKLATMIEFGQELGSKWQFRMGIEYIVKAKFHTRTGFISDARRGYFGFGFKFDRIEADYALDLHPYLGITQQAGLTVSWP